MGCYIFDDLKSVGKRSNFYPGIDEMVGCEIVQASHLIERWRLDQFRILKKTFAGAKADENLIVPLCRSHVRIWMFRWVLISYIIYKCTTPCIAKWYCLTTTIPFFPTHSPIAQQTFRSHHIHIHIRVFVFFSLLFLTKKDKVELGQVTAVNAVQSSELWIVEFCEGV